jgi:hypothetical protein
MTNVTSSEPLSSLTLGRKPSAGDAASSRIPKDPHETVAVPPGVPNERVLVGVPDGWIVAVDVRVGSSTGGEVGAVVVEVALADGAAVDAGAC